MSVKYPNVRVKLVGEDGNPFSILAKVKTALKKAGVPKEETDQYLSEAMGGDYNNLLQVTMKWVNVE